MRDRFGAKDERSWKLRFHTQTAGVSLTAQQPYNNVVRTALQALAAVLGGTNSLHTNSLDEALALPTAEAATLALRTQQIIAHESGVTNTVDPLGGSYFVERLTLDMERGATRVLRRRSIASAAWSRRSRRASRSARLPRPRTSSSRRSSAARRSSSASTTSSRRTRRRCRSSTSTRRTAETQLARLDELRRTRDNDAVQPLARRAAGSRARHGQHDVPAARLRPRLRHRRRDVRCAPRGVGGISGSAADLAASCQLPASS